MNSLVLKSIGGAVFLAVSFFADAQVGGAPTDTDLKAAYCLAADNATLAVLQSGLPSIPDTPQAKPYRAETEAQIAALRSDIERLQAYVVPKLQYLDTLAMTAAINRGKSDTQVATNEVGSCMAAANGSDDIARSCLAAAPAGSRIRTCKGATFLPY